MREVESQPDRVVMKDDELVHRIAGGDDEAFLRFYQRHGQDVFSFAMRSLGRREAAEDITHDAFLALLERPSGYDPSRGELRLYLFGIARNLIRKRLKREAAAISPWPAEVVYERGWDPDRAAQETELADRVRRAIFELPPLQREALILFHYQGFSLDEICRLTGDSLEAVKQRLFRARAALRRELVADQSMSNTGK